jgi:hypothetical protein
MEIDQAIIQLGINLDDWFDKNRATFESQDRAAQGRALLRGFDLVKKLDQLKADGMAAIAALLARNESISSDERVASLLRGFEFAARLADILYDELLDTDGERAVRRSMDAIVQALDKIGRGRAALEALFESPDAGVRGSAAAYVIDLVPERAVPLLREIEQSEHANSAHFNAHWALLAWERERKSRFNYLNEKPVHR